MSHVHFLETFNPPGIWVVCHVFNSVLKLSNMWGRQSWRVLEIAYGKRTVIDPWWLTEHIGRTYLKQGSLRREFTWYARRREKHTYDFCRYWIDESWHSLERVRWKETKSRSQRCLDPIDDSGFLFWIRFMSLRFSTVWVVTVFRRGKIGEKNRWLHRGRHSRYSQKDKDGIGRLDCLGCRSRGLLKGSGY